MDYEEFRKEQKSFELMAAYLNGSTVNLTADGEPRRYTGAYTTEDFLRILGVQPLMGRDFTEEDNKPGAPKVLLSSHGVWQRDFGGAPNIVGKDVRLNGKPATIIGVMPQGFSFPQNEEMWIPLLQRVPAKAAGTIRRATTPPSSASSGKDVSLDPAQAEFAGFARRFAAAYPDTNKQFNDAQIQPLIKTFTPLPIRGMLLTMLAFGVGVLLIALRQRDEHAVRPGHHRAQGTGHPLLPRRHPHPPRSARCSPRACSWPPSARCSASASRTSRWTGSPPRSGPSRTARRAGWSSRSTASALLITVAATFAGRPVLRA